MSRPRLKSFNGCDTCRRRRKKCDEVRPRCGNCNPSLFTCTWKFVGKAFIDRKHLQEIQFHELAFVNSDREPSQPKFNEYEATNTWQFGGMSAPPIQNKNLGIPERPEKFHYQLRNYYSKFLHNRFCSVEGWRKTDFYSFRHFLLHTGPGLRGSLDNDQLLWNEILPSIALEVPVVRAAVSAVAAFHRDCAMNNSLIIRRPSMFALEQYARCTHALANYRSDSLFLEVLLLSCVLLTLCEAMQGRCLAAMSHVQGGLRIFASRQQRKLHSTESLEESKALSLIVVPLFRLARQLVELNLPASFAITPTFGASRLCSFHSVEDAVITFESLFSDATFMPRANLGYSTEKSAKTSRQSDIVDRYRSWDQAFDKFLRSNHEADSKSSHRSDTNILMLKMYQRLLFIMLNLDWELKELAYDDFIGEAKDIVHYAACIIKERHPNTLCRASPGSLSQASSQQAPELIFTMTALSPLPPLYAVAHRCRDPLIRRQAVELLRLSNWRDGMWTSHLTAQVMSRVIQIEETNALEDGTLSGTIQSASQIPCSARLVHVWPKIEDGEILSLDYTRCEPEPWVPSDESGPKGLREELFRL